jgi:hypothetical protein
MPDSVTSVFSEPEDFEAALGKEGCLGLLITGRAPFRARLTEIKLHRLRLSGGDEQLSRIAFVAVPQDLVLISFRSALHLPRSGMGYGFDRGRS